MAPQELNTMKIGTNENDNEISPAVQSDANKKEAACRKVNGQEELDDLMARATRLLKVDEQQILEVNIQCPSPKPKIQKVPALLRKNSKFAGDQYCSPKMISFGPIHHHRKNVDLQLGQQLKYLWAFCFIDRIACKEGEHPDIEHAKRTLYGAVRQDLQQLRNQFSKDVTQDYNDEELAQLLFVDGCALLYFMSNMLVDKGNPDELLMIKFDQLWCIWRDIIMLENQIPMKLLQLLTRDFKSVLDKALLSCLFVDIPKDRAIDNEFYRIAFTLCALEPSHLLDCIRLYYATDSIKLPDVVPLIIEFAH
ncbi:hypothetical protein PIB30_026918 [Stylosanthes scabra]|uniref:Uncharacterized protein n=1 Tax=Stylosanthes scabra TaxID=79078 RepID=A0ABU6X824_9FABA|nr:hypothetical protein [Stylosanthes scabra]